MQGAHLTRCPPTFPPSPQCPPPPPPVNVDIVNCAQIAGVENFSIGEGILDKSRLWSINHLGRVGWWMVSLVHLYPLLLLLVIWSIRWYQLKSDPVYFYLAQGRGVRRSGHLECFPFLLLENFKVSEKWNHSFADKVSWDKATSTRSAVFTPKLRQFYP